MDLPGQLDMFEAAARRVRQPRAHDRRAVQNRTAIDTTSQPCKVQQQFKDEVDVNTIVRRFGVGQIPAGREDGVYGDFTGIDSFSSAAERVELARRGFMALPAETRERFDNDPGRFLRETSEMSARDLDGLQQSLEPREPEPSAPATSDPPKAGPAPSEGASVGNGGA